MQQIRYTNFVEPISYCWCHLQSDYSYSWTARLLLWQQYVKPQMSV